MQQKRPITTLLSASLLGALAAFIMLPSLGGGALGARTIDALGSWWFQWWVDAQLSAGGSLQRAEIMFHPFGKDVVADTGANLVDALLAVPFRHAWGPVGGWNALAALILISNGAVAAFWSHRMRLGLPATLLAGAVTTLHPYVLFELEQGRPAQAMLAPMLATIGLAQATFATQDPRRATRLSIVTGLTLALTAWVYWYAGFFVALALVLLALTHPGRPRLTRLTMIGALSVLATSPVLIPLATAAMTDCVPAALATESWLKATPEIVNRAGDAVALCTLTLGEGACQAGQLTSRGWSGTGPILGILPLVLALAAGLHGRRWWLVGLLAIGIAIGPLPGGSGNPLYLALVSVVPGFARLYWPCRALALIVPLTAMGAAALVHKAGPRPGRWLAGGLLLALLIEGRLQGSTPLSTWSPEAPAWAHCLAGEEGGVIVLPWGVDQEPLLAQTVHEKPTLGGMNERSRALVPAALTELRSTNAWLRDLLHAPRNPRVPSEAPAEDKAAIGALGHRWVVLRRQPMIDTHLRTGQDHRLRATQLRMTNLAGVPVYMDEDAWIFAPWGHSLGCSTP